MANKAQAAPIPPVLTLHRIGNTFVLRTFDLADSPLALGLARMLSESAEALIVTTPLDTKLFRFGPSAVPSTGAPGPLPPTEEEEEDTMAAVERQAAEAHADAVAAGLETDDAGNEIVGETPQGTKVVRRKKRPAAVEAGQTAVCGRCNGRGQVPMLLEGGKAGKALCPVCKGTGQIKKYGASPARRK